MARAPLTACTASSALWHRINVELDESLTEKFGREKEEVFRGSIYLQQTLPKERFDQVPVSGLGVYTYLSRLAQGLRQLMAGARKFMLEDGDARPDRGDLTALTRQAAEISGIPFVMEHDQEKAEEILGGALRA
jgi:hypothetical protein